MTVGSISIILTSLFSCFIIVQSADSEGESPFGYDPAFNNSPSNWGKLDPGFSVCDSGKKQSPIDVPSFVRIGNSSSKPWVQYGFGQYKITKDSVNFALSCSSTICSSVFLDDVTYNLINIHFHSPSEHTRQGRSYPLEAHLVHREANGTLAVISILFEYGAQNEGVQTILNNIDNENDFQLYTAKFLERTGYCRYDGSLTTPPCSESVNWVLSATSGYVSKEQVDLYRKKVGPKGFGQNFGNNRPIQDMHNREVTCYFS